MTHQNTWALSKWKHLNIRFHIGSCSARLPSWQKHIRLFHFLTPQTKSNPTNASMGRKRVIYILLSYRMHGFSSCWEAQRWPAPKLKIRHRTKETTENAQRRMRRNKLWRKHACVWALCPVWHRVSCTASAHCLHFAQRKPDNGTVAGRIFDEKEFTG